jgi:hypothetical protein
MAIGITNDTFSERPYISVAEYKNAPTSIDYDNLVVGGNLAAQDAELERVILRASSYMDEYLNQNLVANRQTETQRTRFTPQGYIALHPNQNPIISLESFYYGTTPAQLVELTEPSAAWFENQQLIIPISQMSLNWSSQGPLAFGGGIPSQQIFTKYTYVSGFVNNPIVTATAGTTTVTVERSTGIVAGQMLRIIDGANSETVYVSSTYVYGNLAVILDAPLTYSHTAGSTISNMPNALKQACILITTSFIKVRGDNSMTMNITTQPQASLPGANRYGSDIKLALDMVDKYRRIR